MFFFFLSFLLFLYIFDNFEKIHSNTWVSNTMNKKVPEKLNSKLEQQWNWSSNATKTESVSTFELVIEIRFHFLCNKRPNRLKSKILNVPTLYIERLIQSRHSTVSSRHTKQANRQLMWKLNISRRSTQLS